MRVIDLLALLADQDKNTPVQLRADGLQVNLDKIESAEVQEQPQAILLPKTAGKPLRLWEFSVLLAQPALRMRYLYIKDHSGQRPLFGFQLVKGVLVIN